MHKETCPHPEVRDQQRAISANRAFVPRFPLRWGKFHVLKDVEKSLISSFDRVTHSLLARLEAKESEITRKPEE